MSEPTPCAKGHRYRIQLAGGWKIKVRFIRAPRLFAAKEKAWRRYGPIRHVKRVCLCEGPDDSFEIQGKSNVSGTIDEPMKTKKKI